MYGGEKTNLKDAQYWICLGLSATVFLPIVMIACIVMKVVAKKRPDLGIVLQSNDLIPAIFMMWFGISVYTTQAIKALALLPLRFSPRSVRDRLYPSGMPNLKPLLS